jgi:hypothetical protein
VGLLNRRGPKRIAETVIADPELHTVMDDSGAVRSIQAANLTMPDEQLDALWHPMHLERLARTYWKFLSKVTLGLIRVVYTPTDRFVVLLFRPFVLLRFHAPEYELSSDRGIVRWRIRSGLLVANRDQGYLEIDVRRCPPAKPAHGTIHVEVEVANFYPMLAKRFPRFFYANTQSRIHVLVTHGFLRSLARLELAESAVGRFAEAPPEPSRPPAVLPRRGDENVGDTPWPAVAAIAAAAALAGYALFGRR